MSGRKDKGAKVVRLDGDLTIYRAAELKDAVLAPLAAGGRVEFDLSAVSEIDTAGVQLLLLAWREAQARHCQLRLGALSPAVQEVFELLDLAAHFGADAAATAAA